MIVNALVNDCDLRMYEPSDLEDEHSYLQLSMTFTAPMAQLFLYTINIDISRITLDYDEWHTEMAKDGEKILPVLLLDIFGSGSHVETLKGIKDKPCRIQVEDGRIVAIGNFLRNEWLDLRGYDCK